MRRLRLAIAMLGMVCLAAAHAAADGTSVPMICYSEAGTDNIRYVVWEGTAWSSKGTVGNIVNEAPWVVVKNCPTRNEYACGLLDWGDDINLMIYRAGTWTSPLEITTNTGCHYQRAFSLAYESLTGDLLVACWQTGNAASVLYCTWNGVSVSGPTQLVFPSTTQVKWIELYPDPKSNEIMMLVLNGDGELYAVPWSGSSWGTIETLETGVTSATYECFDMAYENQTGDGLVVYGQSGQSKPRYRTWDGSSWSSENAMPSVGSPPRWIRLAADPASDQILFGSSDNAKDLNVNAWNGSAWGSNQELCKEIVWNTMRSFDIAYECGGTQALIVYPYNWENPLRYRTWNGSDWSSQITGPSTGQSLTTPQLLSGLTAGQIFFATQDDGEDLEFLTWDGSAFSSSTQLESMQTNWGTPAYMLAMPTKLPDALIGHWELDDETGSGAADAIGLHPGTLHNFPSDDSQWTECGIHGGALIFDGVNDYVDLGTMDVTGSGITLAAWFKAASFDTDDPCLISKAVGEAVKDHYWMLGFDTASNVPGLRFRLKTSSGSTTQMSYSMPDVLPDEWHHAAATYDGSTMRVYIDGVLLGTTAKSGSASTSNSASVWIGGNPSGATDRPFHGTIDDTRIYNYALDADAVADLANCGLVAHWKFDDMSGTTAIDSSDNSFDGTLKNMDPATDWVSGASGGALDFDGSNDYIDAGDVPVVGTGGITIAAWVNPDEVSNKWCFITCKEVGSTANYGFARGGHFSGGSDEIRFYFSSSVGWHVWESTDIKLETGVWTHVAATYDEKTEPIIYKNGVPATISRYMGYESGSTTSYPPLPECTGPTYIARDPDGRRWNGMLDDVRIYSYPLCQSEIAALVGAGPGLFTDVSAASGFAVQTSNDDSYGSGLHWGDLDNDGDLDAIITGNSQAKLAVNQGDSTFAVSNMGKGILYRQGALLDYENDGDLDFWGLPNYNNETLYANNGSATFTDEGPLGFAAPTNNEGLAAADINGDGRCDVVEFSENGNWIGLAQPGNENVINGTKDTSYGMNDSGDYGNGDFCSSGDANNDGHLDFFYHYGNGKIFLSNGDGTFTEGDNTSISVTCGDSDKIGSCWGDYDNDGDIDLFVARYDSGSPGTLWKNQLNENPKVPFVEVGSSAGITDTSGQRGCCWGDYDNDGDLDLYIVTRAGLDNVMYQNQGDGTFQAVDVGAKAAGDGHDAVFVDYDNDGDLDLSITQEDATNTLLQNNTDNTNYLKVRLIGRGDGATNVPAIGVRVEVWNAAGTTLLGRREIGTARGYGGTDPLWLHFGGLTNTNTYLVKAYFHTRSINDPYTVSVVPKNESTTIGSTTIPQMITIEEPLGVKVIRWREVPNQPPPPKSK